MFFIYLEPLYNLCYRPRTSLIRLWNDAIRWSEILISGSECWNQLSSYATIQKRNDSNLWCDVLALKFVIFSQYPAGTISTVSQTLQHLRNRPVFYSELCCYSLIVTSPSSLMSASTFSLLCSSKARQGHPLRDWSVIICVPVNKILQPPSLNSAVNLSCECFHLNEKFNPVCCRNDIPMSAKELM